MRHKKSIILLLIVVLSIVFMLNSVYSDTMPSVAGFSGAVLSFPIPVEHPSLVKQSIPVDQPAQIISFPMPAKLPTIVAQAAPVTQASPVEQPKPVGQSLPVGQSIPIGQSNNKTVTEGNIPAADLFGQRGGRFHPFLLLEGIYTDNLFATHSHTKDDFVTTAAPGIWLAFPANREKLLTIDTTTTSPGGLKLSRIKPAATRRYQTYLLYSPEFVSYSGYSRHDHVNHKGEGLFQYNFNSGLSFDFIDLFNYKEDIAGNGVIDTLYRHQDNLFDFITTYETPSGKLKLKFDYSNYDLNYRDNVVSYRDRNDNSFGFSAFYKFWPKTSLFGEYNYSKINFDHGTADDSVENRFYAGVNWDITAKTRGRLKLGYITKNFDSAGTEDQDGFSIELQAQHNLTSKLAIQANGYRKFNESDMSDASSFLSTGIDVALIQRFNAKWSGTLDASYERNEYNGVTRDDDLYSFGPAVRFKPKKYLLFDLGAQFYDNNSNVSIFDYTAYQIFFRVTLTM